MGNVIVNQFVSLDGVIEDPDGSGGTPFGGWAFRFGPEAVAGDKFALDEVLDTAVKLLGRRTWELFAGLWPNRTDPFARKLNAMPKAVASRTLEDVGAWENSSLLTGDLVTEVARLRETRDVVVTGSASIVDTLAAHDMVDQYRLLVFPVVLGQGRRLFQHAAGPMDADLVSAAPSGQAVLMIHDRRR